MKLKTLFTLLLTIFSFNKIMALSDVKMAERVRTKFIQKITQKNKDIFITGTGLGFRNDIYSIDVTICYQKAFLLHEVRKIIFQYANELIALINEEKELRPYLHNFPATMQNIDLIIRFIESPSTFIFFDRPFVAEVIAYKNGFIYTYRDSKNPKQTSYDKKDIIYESYEEALRKINETKDS